MAEEREDTEQVPLGQRLLNQPFLLLVAGILVMFILYTGWGMIEILTMPAGKLP